jgi:hypothetical protein
MVDGGYRCADRCDAAEAEAQEARSLQAASVGGNFKVSNYPISSKLLLPLALFFGLGGVAVPFSAAEGDIWQFLFGLSGDNMAYDFISAPISRRVDFGIALCNLGVCLNEQDWRCGFENNDDTSKVQIVSSAWSIKFRLG